MGRRPQLVGGPLDGSTISPGSRPPFVFCAAAPKVNNEYRARTFTMAGSARYLYRETSGSFVYAGHTHRRCPGCAAFVARAVKCALCGHETGTRASR